MTRSIGILLWLSIAGLLLFIQSCNSPTSVLTYNYDMFPLNKGRQYNYSYIRTLINNNDKWIDSGSVRYIIKDSINVSSTLRLWIINENVNLLHQYYFLTDHIGGMRLDSSYLINYNTIDTLKEILVDSHILSCNSFIWHFPLDMEPLPEPFARYSSSSNPELSYDNEYQSGPGITVEHYSEYTKQQYLFEKEIGLKSISYYNSISSDVGFSSRVTRVTLF